ncbi:MAG: helix-turn-helix domain-containing protein [Opitutales bacterium]
MERALFERILVQTRGNMSHASQVLGMTRGTLRHDGSMAMGLWVRIFHVLI